MTRIIISEKKKKGGIDLGMEEGLQPVGKGVLLKAKFKVSNTD